MPYVRTMQGLEKDSEMVSENDMGLRRQLRLKARLGNVRDEWNYYKLCREITQASMVRSCRLLGVFDKIELDKSFYKFYKRIPTTILINFGRKVTGWQLNVACKEGSKIRNKLDDIGTFLQRELEYDLEREFNVVVDDIFSKSPYIKKNIISEKVNSIKLEVLKAIPMEMDNIRRRRVWGLEIIEDFEGNLRESLYELSLDDAYIDRLIKKYHSEDEYGGDKYNMMRLRIIAHQVNLKVLEKEKPVDIKEFFEAIIGFRHAIKEMNSKSE